jgi:hypothetical protein
MIDLRSYPEITKAQKTSEKLGNAHYPAARKYENALARAKCPFCEIYNRDSDWRTVEFEDRHKNCSDCPRHKKVQKCHSDLIKTDSESERYDNNVFARAIFDAFSKTQPKLILWRTGETLLWKEVFGEDFEKLDKNDKSALCCLIDRGWGGYMWADDVIFSDGTSFAKRRDELLLLGQQPEHNLDGAYMAVRDDDMTIDGKNGIVYNRGKDGVIERHNTNRYNSVVERIREDEHRLTHNYKIFVTPQDRYKANALLAVFAAFRGDQEQAKEYKNQVERIVSDLTIKRDAKLDKLVDAI